MKNIIKGCTVVIEDKSFTNSDGKEVEFTEVTVDINGVPVACKVKPSDKALLGYIRAQLPKA